ncbi:HEPN domain-containing protein [Coprobacter fastidiosus]|uniref:HEPN domain-containing protein n=1 Tax=Coprobacter fastidiosus NSB1 = JCM 33896 TaxID=1349822 RepID=A0A495WJ01_9BACT|nr:HEPN domain-containing protein [Coprobacter fastidiosus]ERM89078.1 DNA-binding protein [Coprobacter fastidiosus NSB1 = JCM 33896]RKT61506.1 HEPN domain-containing protein [Coprobacter fastidiosus NSB1 = JCM 33896]BEG61577.1 HEPN domain-containing protein [Coprobacter fastidiosus]
MKTSTSRLPEYARKDLQQIVSLVLENLPRCEMIILYGSYARGTYVEYDERDEFGILTSFMSDYDILVVTSKSDVKEAGQILDSVDQMYYKRPDHQVPIQFINDDIEKLNSDLSEGRYFYTDVKKEGIMLYDSGNYKLERARKLDFEEIRQQAQEYFDEKFKEANEFLVDVANAYSRGNYKRASFYLHQACENLFYTLRLVHTLKNSKQHNLSKLLGATHKYSDELRKIFPRNTKEEKRLFELLRLAYVEARYNPKFVVTKEDIDAILPKVERLRDVVSEVCKSQIETYRENEK